MEISEDDPVFGLVSTRMVSVLKPSTSPASPMVPSRSSEPRISQLSPAVSALDVSQVCLLSWSSTQFQAENTPIPSARISTRKMERTIRPTRGLLFGTEAVAGEDGTDRSAVETEDDPRNCCVGLAVRVCSGAKDTGDDEGFLLVSLVARAAGWKLCGTEEEGRAVRLAGFTDDAWSERFAGAKLAGWLGALCEREESVDGMVFLRPDDGMKLGGTFVGSFAPLPSLMVPPKRFVPASYVERGRDCVVYVSSLPEIGRAHV